MPSPGRRSLGLKLQDAIILATRNSRDVPASLDGVLHPDGLKPT